MVSITTIDAGELEQVSGLAAHGERHDTCGKNEQGEKHSPPCIHEELGATSIPAIYRHICEYIDHEEDSCWQENEAA